MSRQVAHLDTTASPQDFELTHLFRKFLAVVDVEAGAAVVVAVVVEGRGLAELLLPLDLTETFGQNLELKAKKIKNWH